MREELILPRRSLIGSSFTITFRGDRILEDADTLRILIEDGLDILSSLEQVLNKPTDYASKKKWLEIQTYLEPNSKSASRMGMKGTGFCPALCEMARKTQYLQKQVTASSPEGKPWRKTWQMEGDRQAWCTTAKVMVSPPHHQHHKLSFHPPQPIPSQIPQWPIHPNASHGTWTWAWR